MRKSLKTLSMIVVILFIFTGSASARGLLSSGMRGNDVKELQNDLHTLDYSVGSIDGIFGQNTKNAVMDLQRDHNLSVDGIAGSNTFSAIEKALGNQDSSAPSRSEVGSSTRLLKYEMRGSDVKNLQNTLNSLGYHAGSADGIFGKNTKNAVMDFQRDHSLSVDGIAGSNTFAAIEKALNSGNTKPSAPSQEQNNASLLKLGMRGSGVKNLQNNLNSLGYHAGSADGIFGQNTKNAVVAFQRDHGLSVDGIAGPATLSKINAQLSQSSNRGPVASRSIIEKVIASAKSYTGVPYAWGGTSPSGFDCSGFTYYVMRENGLNISRTSSSQYKEGRAVSRSNLQRGDFVFFNTSGSGISHVGIYLGNNEFISATSSKGVTTYSLSNSYWSPKYVGARRIIN